VPGSGAAGAATLAVDRVGRLVILFHSLPPAELKVMSTAGPPFESVPSRTDDVPAGRLLSIFQWYPDGRTGVAQLRDWKRSVWSTQNPSLGSDAVVGVLGRGRWWGPDAAAAKWIRAWCRGCCRLGQRDPAARSRSGRCRPAGRWPPRHRGIDPFLQHWDGVRLGLGDRDPVTAGTAGGSASTGWSGPWQMAMVNSEPPTMSRPLCRVMS